MESMRRVITLRTSTQSVFRRAPSQSPKTTPRIYRYVLISWIYVIRRHAPTGSFLIKTKCGSSTGTGPIISFPASPPRTSLAILWSPMHVLVPATTRHTPIGAYCDLHWFRPQKLVRGKKQSKLPGFRGWIHMRYRSFLLIHLALTCAAIFRRKIHVEKDSRSKHGVILGGKLRIKTNLPAFPGCPPLITAIYFFIRSHSASTCPRSFLVRV